VTSLIATPVGSGAGMAVLPDLTATDAEALAPVALTVASAVTPVKVTAAPPAAFVVAKLVDKVPPLVTKLTTTPPSGSFAASATDALIVIGVVALTAVGGDALSVSVVPVIEIPTAPVTAPLVAVISTSRLARSAPRPNVAVIRPC